MSLFRSERVAVALCADRVGLVWRAGRADEQSALLATSCEELHQDGALALDALQDWLKAARPRPTRGVIALSARLVRYALIPWPNTYLTDAEDRAWIRLQFEALHGDMTGWRMQADAGSYGRARVACAVPESTVARIHDLWRADRFKVTAVVPYFLCCWNRWRRGASRAGGLFGVSESDRVVWASHGHAGWAGLRAVTARAGPAEMPQLASRERALLGQAGDATVCLHVPGHNTQPTGIAPDGVRLNWLVSKTADEPSAIAMARLLACR